SASSNERHDATKPLCSCVPPSNARTSQAGRAAERVREAVGNCLRRMAQVVDPVGGSSPTSCAGKRAYSTLFGRGRTLPNGHVDGFSELGHFSSQPTKPCLKSGARM